MSKRSKKLEEIRNMFKDIDINFEDINDNGINEFIKIIKLTKDERYQPNTKHLMSDIIMITFFAIISKATEWKEIESFAKKEEKWLKKYLELPNGIPSHDTIQRVISILDPQILYEICLKYFIEIVDKYVPKEEHEKDVYSIDGKTTNSSSRSSLTTTKINPLNTMSVYSHNYGVSIIQDYIKEKNNEIPMGSKLLEQLDLKNCIVTSDALNTQKETVKSIIKKHGDYVLALKGNQKNFYNEIREYFLDNEFLKQIEQENFFEETEKSHSKIINRKYYLTNDIKWINGYKNWKGLKSIGLEIKTIENLQTGEVTEERRHYIVSFENDIKNFKEAVRKHWGIENNLHAPLDIIFKEDKNKTLEKNGARNLGILRRIALMILKLVQVFYNKSMKLIMYELSLDFENEIENIFKLLKPELINQLKNT